VANEKSADGVIGRVIGLRATLRSPVRMIKAYRRGESRLTPGCTLRTITSDKFLPNSKVEATPRPGTVLDDTMPEEFTFC